MSAASSEDEVFVDTATSATSGAGVGSQP
eukprot:COSAG05_NODE_3301_length_2160_cov_1.379961_3_plen_28_part_01